MEDNQYICRCSDLTLKDIRALIQQGYTTFDELKRIARVGMGPCQGRTCMLLVLKELSIATGKSIQELSPGTFRPPVKPIKLGTIVAHALKGESEVGHD